MPQYIQGPPPYTLPDGERQVQQAISGVILNIYLPDMQTAEMHGTGKISCTGRICGLHGRQGSICIFFTGCTTGNIRTDKKIPVRPQTDQVFRAVTFEDYKRSPRTKGHGFHHMQPSCIFPDGKRQCKPPAFRNQGNCTQPADNGEKYQNRFEYFGSHCIFPQRACPASGLYGIRLKEYYPVSSLPRKYACRKRSRGSRRHSSLLLTRTGPVCPGVSFSLRIPRRRATSRYASVTCPRSLRKRSLSMI